MSVQNDNLTGSLISLITNAQVRYEGTLIEINRAERSMNLRDVRSFGTEGRRDGKNEIQAHENTIPSVVFKVDHVKDFQIIKRPEAQEQEEQAKPEIEQQDPAIISAQQEANSDQPRQAQGGDNQETRQQKPGCRGGPAQQSRELEQWQGDPADAPKLNKALGSGNALHQNRDNNYNQRRGGGRGGGGQGGYQQSHQRTNLKMGTVKETPNPALQAKLSENFDFSQRTLEEQKGSNAAKPNEETKAEPNAATQGEQEPQQENTSGADGFFDSFSKSGPELGRGRGRGRGAMEQIHQRDSDTFGAQSSQGFRYQEGQRRGGRGNRGRGGDRGRGQYRGRGRGYQGGEDYYQGNNRGGGGDWSRSGRGGYQDRRGGYGSNNNGGYRGRGGGGFHRSTGDPLADQRREEAQAASQM